MLFFLIRLVLIIYLDNFMSSLRLNRYENNKNFFLTSSIVVTFITLFLLLLAVCGYRYNYFTVGYSLLFLIGFRTTDKNQAARPLLQRRRH